MSGGCPRPELSLLLEVPPRPAMRIFLFRLLRVQVKLGKDVSPKRFGWNGERTNFLRNLCVKSSQRRDVFLSARCSILAFKTEIGLGFSRHPWAGPYFRGRWDFNPCVCGEPLARGVNIRRSRRFFVESPCQKREKHLFDAYPAPGKNPPRKNAGWATSSNPE